MNYRMIAYLSGIIILIEACFMLMPALVALIYGEQSGIWFLVTLAAAAVLGFALVRLKPAKRNMYAKEGFVITALAWIVISLVGAAPFTLSGQIPSYLDAVFEMVSGFTTTGASIVPNVEELDRCMNFWRCLSHWLGGMPLFDSLCHAFGTAGTGGFGIKAASVGAYDSYYLQTIIAVFMVLFGVNFNVYFFLLIRRWSDAFRNTEVKVYVSVIITSVVVIGCSIIPMMPSVYDAFHHAFFAVATIITTTGFATVDFNLWPELSRLILVLLMFIGACAGSTGGGIKVSRFVILTKATTAEVRKLLHPRSVRVMTIDGKQVSRETIQGVQGYLVVYLLIFVVSILLVSLDNCDMTTSVTAVAATLNNIGPGLNLVGPTGNYAFFSPLSKIILTLDMLFGRLELFPMVILLMPSTWRKH